MTCGSRLLMASLQRLQLSDNIVSVDTVLMDNRIGEKEMAEFEKKESEFLSPSDLVGKSGIVLKILDEIKPERTDFGAKPTGRVEYKDGLATVQKIMRFNQLMINALIDKSKSMDSKKWIGVEMPVKISIIKGNNAIVPNLEVA